MPPSASQGGGKAPGYAMQRRLRAARVKEFDIIQQFKYGYRNREDQTNLPSGVLVAGSKNVLTNVSERIQCRKGYSVDGVASAVAAPIVSAFTFFNHIGTENNVRAYIPTPSTGTLEYRSISPTGVVTWVTLLSGLTSASFNFTTFWDTTEAERVLLMVNGGTNIWEWNGAIGTIASVTNNTITKQGTDTWTTDGFYVSNSPRKVTIRGVDYTYTGGENTTTLTGVTPDPTAQGGNTPQAGDEVHQTPINTTSGSIMSLGLIHNDLISSLRNQVYVGQLTNNQVYVSKVNNYKDYSFTSPTRIVGEGAIAYLDAPPVALVPLETSINISAGKDQWYVIAWTLSADLTKESVTVNRLKTNSNAAAQSQALTSAMKNDVIFISQEPTLDRLGRVENILGTTQTTNLSDPIKLDFDSYNFTGGSIFYNKYFIYISVPSSGLVLIYNIVKSYWEAPQTIPISVFYTVGGVLYGHSYNSSESYELFTGRADRVTSTSSGTPIACNATFSFQNYASPFSLKNFNKFYVEGYISSNTTLNLGITYDMNGCATITSYQILGTGSYVCIGTGQEPTDDQSLGKHALGKYPLGGNLNQLGANALPPKFRIIKTFPRVNFHENQVSFSSSQTDSNWEILRFGGAMEYSTDIPTNITQ